MSNLKIAFAAVAALGLLGGVAYAKTDVTAKLATPQAERTRVIAAGVVWTCEADACTAQLVRTPNVRSCMELAGEVGTITAFAALNEADIGRCNTRAAVTATTAIAQR